MASYDPEKAARLKHVGALAEKTSAALTALDTKYNGAFQSAAIVNNQLLLYTSKDKSGTAAWTLDLPEELYLQQTGTEIVENFAFSAATYPGATDPNLNGKTVLILKVTGTKSNPTVKYSFVDLAKVMKAYTAGDNSINVSGYTLTVKISATTGNLLELKNDGLFVGSDDSKVDKVTGKQLSTEDYTTAEKTKLAGVETGAQVNVIESVKVDGTALTITGKAVNVDLSGKVDKVTSATSGNLVTFGSNGAIADSGVTFATDAEVNAMLEEYFPTA